MKEEGLQNPDYQTCTSCLLRKPPEDFQSLAKDEWKRRSAQPLKICKPCRIARREDWLLRKYGHDKLIEVRGPCSNADCTLPALDGERYCLEHLPETDWWRETRDPNAVKKPKVYMWRMTCILCSWDEYVRGTEAQGKASAIVGIKCPRCGGYVEVINERILVARAGM